MESVAMLHSKTQTQGAQPRRRWFIPVAAAASVSLTLVGGATAWGDSGIDGIPRASTAVSSTLTSAASTTASNAAGTATATQMTLPAYFVGATSSTSGPRFGLYREFVRTAVPAGATPAQKARAAIAVAMTTQPFASIEHYVQPWSGTSVRNLTVTPSLITVSLSGPGSKGFRADQTTLAVQALVWTAQAAIGQGPIPVKFAVADGSAMMFGAYSTARTYNRPAMDLAYLELAPIWITSPERGQVFSAGMPVVAKGQSCAFEANTQWQLKKGGAAVRSGFATATSGCPSRGIWEVNLGVLAAGVYTFRMYEVSMEDGQGIADVKGLHREIAAPNPPAQRR